MNKIISNFEPRIALPISNTMIRIQNIHKQYGNLVVLDGVSCQINEGEVISIVGPSGAGKSTLLHIVGALDKPDSGQVAIDGTEISTLNAKEQAHFRNKNIGFVFQFHHLLPEFTALENVSLPALIAKENEADVKKRATFLLGELGLSKRINHFPNQMSGGEQQRVAVARALINSPKVVLADEPSGNLDSNSAEDLHNLFFKLRKELGQTFVIVTHNQKLAQITDRTLLMKDGKIIN